MKSRACLKYFVRGYAMGSPLGPSMANALLAHHKQNWLESCPLEYRPLYYRRFADGIIVLFKSSDQVKRFQSYLSSRHVNMSFTIETEQNNKMSRCQQQQQEDNKMSMLFVSRVNYNRCLSKINV